MDIKIKTETMRFNYCARAIITQDEKVLILCVNDAEYYHLPGGHVEIGETSEHAVMREVQEETGLEITVNQLVVVQEQFYQKKDTDNQSLILYYCATPKNRVEPQNFIHWEQGRTKMNKNQLRWVSLDELEDLDLRPASVKKIVLKNDFKTLQHIIDAD